MSQNTTTTTRVSAEDISRVVAAFPAARTASRNAFGGYSHSKAALWDFCLLAMPDKGWTAADIARVYHGVHARGIFPMDAHGVAKGVYSAAADADAAAANVRLVAMNPQHTAEHTSTKDQRKACYIPGKGLVAHVVVVGGLFQLNPEWRAVLGSGINAGYPGCLPLPSATPSKTAASKGKGKTAASKGKSSK